MPVYISINYEQFVEAFRKTYHKIIKSILVIG